jgi:hypothetical protein
MTAAHRGQPGEDPDIGFMRDLRYELAVRGIVMGNPAEGVPVPFREIPGAWCEIGILDGRLAWTHLPQGRDLSPDQAVQPALALLEDPTLPRPDAPHTTDLWLPPNDAAGRALAGRGLAVHPARFDYGDGELHAGIFVTSPGRPTRGHLQIGELELRWECRLACLGSPTQGLSLSCIAQAIAAALEGTAGAPGG